MPDQAIHEMVSAFASGCIDKANYQNFKNYLESKGSLPYGELGELQNLMVLIPTILEMETPPPDLKNDVAKSLIKLQKKASNPRRLTGEIDEIVEPLIKPSVPKIKPSTPESPEVLDRKDFLPSREEVLGESEKQETVAASPEIENKSRYAETIMNEDDVAQTKMDNEDEIRRRRSESYRDIPRLTDSPGPEIPNIRDILDSHDPGFTTWSRNNLIITIVSSIIILVIVLFIYTGFESHLEEYRTEVAKLKTDLRKSTEFIDEHGALITFFNFSDIQFANLNGGTEFEESTGKLLLAFEEGEGLLKTTSLFPSPNKTIYQLWMVSRGGFYSLLKFQSNSTGKFLKFSNFPYIPPQDVNGFRITIEPEGGSETPTGKTVLIGDFRVR
ncbi:MAG: anti-sigma factor [Melioribacteraceae bacterium]|nr:anti-sigma factor [Melioribacteraceae bacterium]MCF8263565.1 anti-sigma factor [Melioribacteraceae bacterium]MCF8431240.1 anti-sigma factor [Melioribacteraceae bacterium]